MGAVSAIVSSREAFESQSSTPTTINLIPFAIEFTINPIALAIQTVADTIAFAIQAGVDSIPFVVQAGGQFVVAVVFGTRGPIVESVIDAVATFIQTCLHAITAILCIGGGHGANTNKCNTQEQSIFHRCFFTIAFTTDFQDGGMVNQPVDGGPVRRQPLRAQSVSARRFGSAAVGRAERNSPRP